VNESGYKFTVVGDARIRFGLGAIRNVGRNAIESILAARAERPFDDLYDLCARVDLRMCNRRVFEALIGSGALDDLGGAHRAQLLAGLDTAMQAAQLQQEERETGQASLFGEPEPAAGSAPGTSATRPPLPTVAPMSESERLQTEKAILGFYVSGHPLEPFRLESELFATHTVAQLGHWQPDPMTLAVVVTAIKRQVSKRSGQEFARLAVEDFSGAAELLVFPEKWAAIGSQVVVDVPLLITGGYSRRDQGQESPSFIVESIRRMAEVRADGELTVSLTIDQPGVLAPAVMDDVRAVAEAHPGACPLELHWTGGPTGTTRWRSRSLRVAASGAVLTELRALLGEDRVRLLRGS
jgi:DNA polymerase-3 subunit alpha